jgi:hypothetical protein
VRLAGRDDPVAFRDRAQIGDERLKPPRQRGGRPFDLGDILGDMADGEDAMPFARQP